MHKKANVQTEPLIQTTGRIDPAAQVLDRASIGGHASLLRNVVVRDDAVVKESAILIGNVDVSGDAVVMGRANVQSSLGKRVSIGQNAWVMGGSIRNIAPISGPVPYSIGGHAMVKGQVVLRGYCQIFGSAQVYEYAVVEDHAKIFGNARVHGRCMITGDAVVRGNANISGDAILRGGVWDGSEGRVAEGDWLEPGVRNPSSDAQNANYQSFQDRAGPSYRTPELEAIKQQADARYLAASENKLRTQLIRLAHANPEMREHLLPLLKNAEEENEHEAGRKWDGGSQKPTDSVPYNKHRSHPPAGEDGSKERKRYNQWYRDSVCPDASNQCGLNEPGQ